MKTKIAIIGSGFGGISAAALLAKKGYQVTVFEKNEQVGGRASTLTEEGFHFDMGPSWYMMPDVFERWFQEFGYQPSDFFKLHPLNPQYKVVFEDGDSIEVSGDLEEDAAVFESYEKGAGEQLRRYIAEGKMKYDIAIGDILYKNADHFWQLATPELVLNAHKVGTFQSLHSYVKRFFKHPKLQQVMEYNVVFLGCSPYNAPALFSMMGYVDIGLGVFYPEGGIGAVISAMEKIAKKQKVKFKLNSPVEKIITKNGRAIGLVVKGKQHDFDVVISNAEHPHVSTLIDDPTLVDQTDSNWKKKVMTPSAFLLYLGVKGNLPEVSHHTLYFGDDWREHFKAVFDAPAWPTSPSVYINKPSATDNSVAPKGHENLMILVPIAAGLEDNQAWKEQYASYIVKYLDQKMKLKIADNIVYQKIFSVSDFAQRYNSFQGNALGGIAHTFFQSATWRPRNKSRTIDNLYYVGATTVPGIGMPTSLISGHVVADRVAQNHS